MKHKPCRAHEASSHLFALDGPQWLLLGSSGEEGKQAVNELALLAKAGWSTTTSRTGLPGQSEFSRRKCYAWH